MPSTVRKIAHTGITVGDLDGAIALWRDVLGFELVGTAEAEGPVLSDLVGVPGAALKAAVLTNGEHSIEVLQYLAPEDRQTFRPRPCDVGSVHVALEVDVIDDVIDACRAHGLAPAGGVRTMGEGPLSGTRIAYLRAPDGVTIELLQPPRTP